MEADGGVALLGPELQLALHPAWSGAGGCMEEVLFHDDDKVGAVRVDDSIANWPGRGGAGAGLGCGARRLNAHEAALSGCAAPWFTRGLAPLFRPSDAPWTPWDVPPSPPALATCRMAGCGAGARPAHLCEAPPPSPPRGTSCDPPAPDAALTYPVLPPSPLQPPSTPAACRPAVCTPAGLPPARGPPLGRRERI